MSDMPNWKKNKIKYSAEYNKATYKRTMVNINKRYYEDVLTPAAQAVGEPISVYIKTAIEERVNRQNGDPPEDKPLPRLG